MLQENFFATRHSIKPKAGDPESELYSGVSEKGVDLARERAKEILEIINNEPAGTVMFLAGSSEAPRAKNAARIYGEEMDRILESSNNEEILTISNKNIKDISEKEDGSGEKPGYNQIIENIIEKIKANPEKKVIVDFPMFIKEFAFGNDRWTDKDGKYTEYVNELLAKYNNDAEECLKDWIVNEGKLGNLSGPNPTEMAEEQLYGVKRLAEFAKQYLGEDRNLLIGSVGHSWNLDALAVYLANNGRVDIEGYEKVGGKMIKETQLMRVGKDKTGKACLFYNNNEYPLE